MNEDEEEDIIEDPMLSDIVVTDYSNCQVRIYRQVDTEGVDIVDWLELNDPHFHESECEYMWCVAGGLEVIEKIL